MAPAKRMKPDTEDEFVRRKRKYTKSAPSTPKSSQKSLSKPSEPCGFTTEPTIDDLIYENAIYHSYDEFEKKFNIWKAKYRHPFRVASSEALRAQDGSISEQFRYRYVVFHCARYGQPRVRGEGKRPNQNYLPCDCKAMMRLNFSFTDQCLKLTSLETRHKNHVISEELYDKMMAKESAKKSATPKPKDPGTPIQKLVKVKSEAKEPSEERTDDESLVRNSEDTDHEFEENYEIAPEVPQEETKPILHAPVPVPAAALAPAPVPLPVVPNITGDFIQQYTPLPYPTAPPIFNNVLDYQLIQSQMNQLQAQMQLPINWSALPQPNFGIAMSLPPIAPMPIPSPSCSITSSTVDENEAPPIFTKLETVRPVALKWSENSAFAKLISGPEAQNAVDPVTTGVLNTAQKLLSSTIDPSVVARRLKELDSLVTSWSKNE